MFRSNTPHLYLVTEQQLHEIRERRKLRTLQTCNRLLFGSIPLVLGLMVATSPRLRVRRILVEGAVRVDPGTVRRLGKYLYGANLLRADVTKLDQALRKQPQIRDAQIVRWPAFPFVNQTALTVRLHEREATFALPSGNRTLLVDEAGKVFDSETRAPEVPVVRLADVKAAVGDTIPRDRLDATLMMLREVRSAQLTEVAAIALDREGFAALTLHDGTSVRLGDEEWARKLRLLPAALARLRDKGGAVEYIDLTTLRAPVWKPAPRPGVLAEPKREFSG